jgi:predicted 3-demethylubiquinone-9 3-methyltransferase (glyoxalase superfamily)
MATTQRIHPCLWFDNQAEEAARYYTGIFKNSRITKTTHYPKAGYEQTHKPAGSVLTVEFVLDGQSFTALNGGPEFKFNEAVSLEIYCDTQEEIDYYWEKLKVGGDPKAQQCGWLKDKFGVSWQVVPSMMGSLIGEKSERSERVFEAMLKMKKIDIATLQKAYDGELVHA